MAEHLLFVGTYAIAPGEFEMWRKNNRDMLEFIRANEPRFLGFWNYVNADGTEVTTVQWHPDSASLEFHMDLARKEIGANVQRVTMKRVELYGQPSERLLAALHSMSERSGNWPISVKGYVQGFTAGMAQAE